MTIKAVLHMEDLMRLVREEVKRQLGDKAKIDDVNFLDDGCSVSELEAEIEITLTDPKEGA